MSEVEQRSPEWWAAKLGKISASNLSCVLASKTTAAYQNYLAKLVAERFTGERDDEDNYQNRAMLLGVEREPIARSEYEFYHGTPDVVEVGFIQHPSMPFAGASPDGLVAADGVLEIKCPQLSAHQQTILGKILKIDYRRQMQFQMDCTGRKWGDFVSYHPKMGVLSLYVRRVESDPELSLQIQAAVIEFENAIQERVADLERLFEERSNVDR